MKNNSGNSNESGDEDGSGNHSGNRSIEINVMNQETLVTENNLEINGIKENFQIQVNDNNLESLQQEKEKKELEIQQRNQKELTKKVQATLTLEQMASYNLAHGMEITLKTCPPLPGFMDPELPKNLVDDEQKRLRMLMRNALNAQNLTADYLLDNDENENIQRDENTNGLDKKIQNDQVKNLQDHEMENSNRASIPTTTSTKIQDVEQYAPSINPALEKERALFALYVAFYQREIEIHQAAVQATINPVMIDPTFLQGLGVNGINGAVCPNGNGVDGTNMPLGLEGGIEFTEEQKKQIEALLTQLQEENKEAAANAGIEEGLVDKIADGKIEGEHMCSICNKEFKSRRTLALHVRRHENNRPYLCPEQECTSSFSQKSHLNSHLLTHSGERPYKCSECPNTYTTPSRRNEHFLSHSKTTKYTCDTCGLKFRNLTNFKNHNVTHLPKEQRPVKTFVCNLCDAVYAQRTSLIRHRNKRHPEEVARRAALKSMGKLKKLNAANAANAASASSSGAVVADKVVEVKEGLGVKESV